MKAFKTLKYAKMSMRQSKDIESRVMEKEKIRVLSFKSKMQNYLEWQIHLRKNLSTAVKVSLGYDQFFYQIQKVK